MCIVYAVDSYSRRKPLAETTLLPLGEEAYERIRQMVMAGVIPSRTLIREAQLARELGMSRTPVREALRRLQAEGFVSAIPQRGYVVREVERDDLVNVYQVRAVLEGLAARLAAARATRADLARLEDLYDAMEAARARGDDDALVQLNSQFHDTVATASGNQYLQSMLTNIREVFERYRPAALIRPGRRNEAHVEHRELLRALRDRQGDRAAHLAAEHVRRALEVRLGSPVEGWEV